MNAELSSAVAGDAAAIIETAVESAGPQPLGEHLATLVVPAGAHVEVIDITEREAQHQSHPARKTGTYRVHDAASFVAYVGRHGTEDTEVWADVQGCKIVAVVNAHEAASSIGGWGDHRVSYVVEHTKAWKAWASKDGQLMSQSDFAELIEERSIDIVRPSAADMLELAQTFEATIGVRFESSKLLSSGERQLEYRETVDAKAGRAGKLEIPRDFDLGLIPFEGAEAFKVTARFRYRITDGVLRVGFRLNRPEDVLREAFESVVAAVEAGVSAPVFRGVSA